MTINYYEFNDFRKGWLREGIMQKKIFVTKAAMPPYEEFVKAIKPLWDTHCLTNMGQYHQELEEKLRNYLKVPELSLMVNGHMALEMAIQSFHFPEGAEIITTPFTFISTTHAIVRNHLKPVFCDVKLNDGTIDETKIEELITEKTVAIVPVHVYGNICNIESIQEIANRFQLKVIYDAAHAFGVEYKGKGIGSYGDAAIYSFHATKVYNSVEGGAVAFSDHEIYGKLYNLKNFGIQGEELVTDIGANAKMNEVTAIMGLCNLKYIDKVILERKKRYEFYRENLKGIKGIRLLERNQEASNNYAYFPILVENTYNQSRDELYIFLQKHNIYARKYFYPLTSDQKCFKGKYLVAKLECARYMSQRVLTLPLYDTLEQESMERIVDIIRYMK